MRAGVLLVQDPILTWEIETKVAGGNDFGSETPAMNFYGSTLSANTMMKIEAV